ncbi:MAG: neutral/alkaline non-lysosomal ceramidase N-terminal domain-containing protein [Myxococcaceae bacterium]|nr:neutral/alkaline non-lysosomal ceramidase N-terminal domain-containing protein [Myxococcaceae bacterium]
MVKHLLLVALLSSCSGTMMGGPAPGPLEVGIATTLVDVPVGAPTGGYSRRKSADDPGSRWALNFPSTTGVHTDATARAIAFSDGVTRTALVRLDVCLTTPSLRARVRQKLDAAGESARFIVQGTHTHAHMARFFEPVHLGNKSGLDITSVGMDVYDAELDDRLATAAASSILGAFANLKRASVGVAALDAGVLNRDRRCENDPVYGPEFRDPTLTVVRFDEVNGDGAPSRPLTAIAHFSVHGTVLPGSNTLLSTDVTGAIELAASDELGVPVFFAQGSAGDVSPGGSPHGHDGTQRLEWLGRAGGRLVRQAFDQAQPGPAAPTALTHLDRGVLMTREALGYQRGEFPEHGGIGCQVGGPGSGSSCGQILTPPEQGGLLCGAVEPRPLTRALVSVLRVGDVAFVTLPGEPSTAVGAKAAQALAPLGVSTRLTLGYAQEHYGYLLEQDDFLRGGYEPSVSPWGWRVGQYLVDEVTRLVSTRASPQESASAARPPGFEPRAFEESEAAPVIIGDTVDVERTQAVTLTFTGGDPALGTPAVSLEQERMGAFTQALASPTRPLQNGPDIIRRYRATPSVAAQPDATRRRHEWTARWEVLPDFALGRYRLVVTGRARVAGTVERYRLESQPFTVLPARSISLVSSRVTGAAVVLTPRYTPNPMRFANGDPSTNLRLWDDASRPETGLPARRGSARVRVDAAPSTSSMVTASWDDGEQGYVVPLPAGVAGAITLTVEPGGLVDGLGNTNATRLSSSVSR